MQLAASGPGIPGGRHRQPEQVQGLPVPRVSGVDHPGVVPVPLPLNAVHLLRWDRTARPPARSTTRSRADPTRPAPAAGIGRRTSPSRSRPGVDGVGRAAEGQLDATREFHQDPVPRMVDGEHVARFRMIENVGDARCRSARAPGGGAPPTTPRRRRGRRSRGRRRPTGRCRGGPRPGCAGRDTAPPVDPGRVPGVADDRLKRVVAPRI